MKPQDTTAMDIRQIREEMEELEEQYAVGFDQNNHPEFEDFFIQSKYNQLQAKLKSLVNNKKY